jgi:acyl-CoA synthetase (AMP-forming)/AMP-acid ligase II
VTLQGRSSDVIDFSGVKILPQDIEPVLLGHPDIADAVLIGVPHAKTGQLPVAFVVPRGKDLDLDALRRYCNERCGVLPQEIDREVPQRRGAAIVRGLYP